MRENLYPRATVFSIFLTLHSLRESEIEHPIVISVTDSTATVTDNSIYDETWDAAFGFQNETSHVLLTPGATEITSILLWIMNDINSEDNETFTLRVSPSDVRGIRCNFECYDGGEDPVEGNYFCSHTITIIDEDGKF